MTAEDRIRDAFRDLDGRTEWLDATRNQAPSTGPQDSRNRPKRPRRPLLALAAAAAIAVGGGAVALSTLSNDTQVVETGPTESSDADGAVTTVLPDDGTGDQQNPDSTGPPDSSVPDGDGQTLTPEGVGMFTSPSGNIACNVSTEGASCWIGDKDWEIEQPTDDPFCEVSDWGNAIDVTAEKVFWPCYTDFGWPVSAEPLAYGDRMQVGEFECRSAEDGVTCLNGSEQGFRVSRAETVIFAGQGQVGQPDQGQGQESRFAVASAAVAADAADPFLNVRDSASPSGDLVAKLPPDYTGMAATGRSETLASGAEWIEVRLIDPVETLGGADNGGYPVGWVNAALTSALPNGLSVTVDDLPPCSGDRVSIATGELDTGYVHGLEHGSMTPACHRVVVSFGVGQSPVFGEVAGAVGRATAIPSVSVNDVGRADAGVTIDLGPLSDAWFAASDTDGGVFLVRGEDDNLDVVTTFPVGDVTMTSFADGGKLVIDLESVGAIAPSGNGVWLLAEPDVGQGSVSVSGVARPFESMLDASIEDSSGAQVEATFTGSGPFVALRATQYGIGTTDWTAAWGLFDLTIEDLDPGDYTIVLNASLSNDPADMFRLDVTVP